MQTIGKLALAASAIFWVSAAVAQDDDTTVTTRHTEHYDSHPHGGAYIGVPGVVGVHVGRDGRGTGCETRSKTVRDEDTGETHTRSVTNC
ncbi:MAG: hypothetical protein AB1508_13105 [Pseudomonadota bacterium]